MLYCFMAKHLHFLKNIFVAVLSLQNTLLIYHNFLSSLVGPELIIIENTLY